MPLNINNNKGEDKVQTANTENIGNSDSSLNESYVEQKHITISLVHNYSLFRKVNMKTMGQRTDVIGSSIHSSQVLSSNKGEVDAYFPQIIGLSPSNPDFIGKVKNWLNNIHFVVNENDVDINASFVWNQKRDYLAFAKKEDKINEAYDKIDRSNLATIRQALKDKINAINTLESEKYKYGHPQDLQQYLIYRHCLLYRDVAKDTALINSDPNVRFYIKDKDKEAARQRKLLDLRKKAISRFVQLCSTDKEFDAVFTEVTVYKNENLAEALLKDRAEKEASLMDYATTYPEHFLKYVNDKNVTTKAMIETLIIRGELIRSEYNQQISSSDGTFIGSNINDAVAYFNDPKNEAIRKAYENKLKLF